MVRRSNEIRREICQIQNVDDLIEKQGSEERCRMNVPGRWGCNRARVGTKRRLR